MTPERWAQIQRVLDGALRLDPAGRDAYVASECALDPELRTEVESLLKQAARLEGFLDSTASPLTPPRLDGVAAGHSLQAGDRVGGYTIIKQIGEGGMGVVYSAHDVHLQRDVALKFLASPGSPEHLERFQREARAACALNHPNVCTIHGIGENQGHPFLVMELLEGQALRDRIRQGPLPAKELIDLAIGMADALACAHAAGIIHRDIKPGNLFVNSSGVAKILDFGLAKRVSTTGEESLHLTGSGRAVGTVAYMSPEQARGEKLDERTDLFSFGAVLYEMATGKPAFDGDTAAVVFSAILNDAPVRPALLNTAIPPGLEAIILKALEKDREVRYQTASDLRADLLRLVRDTGSGESVRATPPPQPQPKRKIRRAVLLGVAALVAAAAMAAWLFFWPSAGTPRVLTSVQLTSDGTVKSYRSGLGYPLMTDGSRIFFSRENEVTTGVAQVSVAGGEVVPIPTPFSPSRAVAMSPDGSKLIVLEGGEHEAPMWLVATVGGAPRRLGDLRAHDATWRPDGRQIAYARGSDLFAANPDGSGSQKLASAGGLIELPRWSPGARVLLYSVYNNQTLRHELFELTPDSGRPPQRVFPQWTEPHGSEFVGAWMPDGRSFLLSAARDRVGLTWIARRPAEGIAARLLRRTTATAEPLLTGPMRTYCAVPSPDGKQIFFVGVVRRGQLARHNPRTTTWEPYLGGVSAEMVSPSRDGKWIVYISYPEGLLWKSRADGKERVQLTPESLVATSPSFSPDGTRIIFTGQRRDGGSPWKLHLLSAEGGELRQIVGGTDAEFSPAWAPDGKSAVYGSFPGSAKPLSIRSVDIATGTTSVIPGSEGLYSPRWSPDGRYLVATAQDGFRPMLYDFNTRQWTRLTDRAVNSPLFSRDGAFLQYDTAVYGEKDIAVFRVRLSDRHVERTASFDGSFTSSTQTPWTGLSADGSLLAMKDLGSQEIYSVRLAP